MSGDYETATDYIEWNTIIWYVIPYLRSIGVTSPYVINYFLLLCVPRFIYNEGWSTVRGVLMGEPGSKIVLTILTRIILRVSQRRFRMLHGDLLRCPLGSAGDDIVGITDELRLLLMIKENSRRVSLLPSKEKWGIFKNGVVYCE